MRSYLFSCILGLTLLTSCDGVFNLKTSRNSTSPSAPITVGNLALQPGVVDSEYLIKLEYETNSGDATQCAVSNLNQLTVTTPCACVSGECTVGVTPNPGHTGSADFEFTVGNPAYESNPGKASFNVDPSVPFITNWRTANPGTSGANQITIPLSAGYNIKVRIEWGDGTQDTITSATDPRLTHTYPGPNDYEVKMYGEIGWFNFNFGGDREKILDVTQWGNYHWRSFENIFRGSTNLTISASDAPNLKSTKSMDYAFQGATNFNSPIGHWDISNIESLMGTFASTHFNQDIGNWNTSKVQNMRMMFNVNSAFNQDISRWNTSKVQNFMRTFYQATAFNQNLNTWNTSSAENMSSMFSGATSFNGQIGSWNVSKVKNFQGMFQFATSFNRPIGNWDVRSATTTATMFAGATAFNQDITQWKLDNVEIITAMFYSMSFNQNISHWRMLKLKDMSQAFRDNPTFNQDISGWPVGNVTSMRGLFDGATNFNQDLSQWDVSKVEDMDSMFRGTSYNHDISNWNVASVKNMQSMFSDNLNFNQDLTGWNVSSVTLYGGFDTNTNLSWTLKPNF